MRAVRDALILHALLAAAGWAVLHLPRAPLLGWGYTGLIAGYNLLLPMLARRNGHHEWLDLWSFALPLSALLVLSDCVLSQQLGLISFPELGAPRVIGVPVYLLGLRVIPLFWVLWLAGRSPLTGALASLLIFPGLEYAASLLHLWRPEHVRTHFGVADYVLLPEVLLGAAAVYAGNAAGGAGWFARLLASLFVTCFYMGALVFAQVASEHLHVGIGF